MILKITQKIIFEIDGTINFGFNKLLLTPQNNENQKILDWKIDIKGGKKELNSKDQFGNQIELVSIQNNSKKIEYNIFGKVETKSNFGIKQITKKTHQQINQTKTQKKENKKKNNNGVISPRGDYPRGVTTPG